MKHLILMVAFLYGSLTLAVEVDGYVDANGKPLRIGTKWYAISTEAAPSLPYPESNYWVGAWHFDVYQGVQTDSSIYTNHLAWVGSPGPTNIQISVTGGETNKAYRLDNIDDYFVLGDKDWYTFSNNMPFTISCWINLDLTNEVNYIASKHDTSSSPLKQEWRLVFAPGVYGVVGFLVNKGQTSLGEIGRGSGDGNWLTGVWYHVAMTYDGGTNYSAIKIWRNAIQVDNTNFGAGNFVVMSNSTADTRIGYLDGGSGDSLFDGVMDDMLWYSTNLTAGQITNHYNNTHPTNKIWTAK